MSKLVQRIERLGKTGPAPLGFGAAARQQATPAMVLVGSTTDPGKVSALANTSLDAILYRAESLNATAPSFGEAVWGVEADTATADQLGGLAEMGCDFAVLRALSVPLDALHQEGMGHLLVVSPDLRKEEARALEAMPIDAVILSEPLPSPLGLDDLLRMATLRGEIGLPFLAPVRSCPSAWEVECLREIGVEGLVPDLDKMGADDLQPLAEAIRGLPRRRPKGDRPTATVPRVRTAAARPQREEPDEDDDDEDF